MTSPVLPDILEAPCINKYTNFKTLNPQPGKTSQNFGHGPAVQQIDRMSVNVYPQSSQLDCLLSTDFDSCSETELKQLKDKFISHVGRIRSFIKQIEARETELDKIEDAESREQGNSVKKGTGKITGQKRMMPITPDHREPKRSKSTMELNSKTMELNSTDARKVEATMMRKCGAILEQLMQHKHGWVFNKPVDVVALRLPDYHHIVKRPMDLGTVKSKLVGRLYATPLDFAKDVRLTFDNAMLYNLKGDPVHTMATVLLDKFDKLFDPAYEKYEVDCQRVIVEHGKPLAEFTQDDDAQEAVCDATPLVKTSLDTENRQQAAKKFVSKKRRPVPEVKGNPRMRRNMSDWERDQLGKVLQELAGEYLDEILRIVGKRNSKTMAPNGDGEIELDFDALDDETMWDLHRFVRLNLKPEQNDKVI